MFGGLRLQNPVKFNDNPIDECVEKVTAQHANLFLRWMNWFEDKERKICNNCESIRPHPDNVQAYEYFTRHLYNLHRFFRALFLLEQDGSAIQRDRVVQ